ncbi:O-antigen polymerase [Paenibacillus curdlanolyticus YK9]|uniref:O-antigen polymerase n=1 Tax=Paenibacillus curdlanolyticus YK9 TaxID=717606 RepID=E0IEQ6_9BACL|nr:O-antigen ligase family protein [Paenibacillus curdlanolyticus]EFM09144.1 O-antigen polymerase [Paenibacillus curdlanolyticus YK9]
MKKYASTNNSLLSSPFTVIALLLGLWFIIFPYQTGLFNALLFNFENSILQAALYLVILLLGTSIVAVMQRKQTEASTLGVVAAVWVIPLCYVISSFGAVSSYYAHWMILINALAAAMFFIAVIGSRHAIGRNMIEWSIVASGYIIVAWGLLNAFGIAYSRDALWEAQPGQYRLTSVFQYSNTYAALLIALFLVALYYSTHAANRYWRALHALMLVPIFVSFMLTLSRAALLLLPVLVLCLLPFLRLSKQILLLLYMIVSIGASLIILSQIDTNMLEIALQVVPSGLQGDAMLFSPFDRLSWSGWLPMLGVSAVVALCACYLHEKLERWLDGRLARIIGRKWSLFAVPAVLIVLFALGAALVLGSSAIRGILPASIADRIENINFQQHSVLERGTFYKDAMKVSSDYPVLGAGGGGWADLYQQYQHNPYTSRQAHNYFIQVLVETGWVGLLAHLAFFIGLLVLYIRGHIRYPERRGSHLVLFIMAFAILAHSMLDFDMSFVYMIAVVFACLGASATAFAPTTGRAKALEAEKASFAASWPSWITPVATGVIAVVAIVYTGQQLSAHSNYDKAIALAQQGKPINEVMVPLDKAIKSSPDHPTFSTVKSQWLMQVYQQTKTESYAKEAGELIDHVYHANPYDEAIISTKYQNEWAIGQEDAALATLEERIAKFNWNISAYSDAMHYYSLSGWNAGTSDKKERRQQLWGRVDELHKEVLRRMEELKKLPEGQLQGREFDIVPAIRQALGFVAYGRGDYAKAIEWTQPLATGDLTKLKEDPTLEYAVRTYLAALDATGQSNDELKNQLFAANPDEEAMLKALIAGRTK